MSFLTQRLAFAFAIFFLSAPPAFAEFDLTFELWSEKWGFHCAGQTEAFDENYESLAKESVYAGLLDLARLNPELYLAVHRRTFGKSLTWDCDQRARRNEGIYARYNPFFINGGIRLTLRAIEDLKTCAQSDRNCQTIKNALLHEFYHFAGLDNNLLSHGHHLQKYMQEFETSQMIDVVYACAAQTFPEKFRFLDIRPLQNGEYKAFSNSQYICSLCAAASPQSGRWSTSVDYTSLQSRVVPEACADLNEPDYLIGYLRKTKRGTLSLELIADREALEKLEKEREETYKKLKEAIERRRHFESGN